MSLRALRVPACAALLWSTPSCSQTEAGKTVATYVGHLRAGRLDPAYAMVESERKQELSVDQWKAAMHTDILGQVQDVSVDGIRTLSPGGTCVYTQLDFIDRPDHGPYGHYIFYLQAESGGYRVQEVLTYDRIEGSGMVKTGHFDESREPFPCSGKRP